MRVHRFLPRATLLAAACVLPLAASAADPPALSCFIPDQQRLALQLAAHPCASAWSSVPAGAWLAALSGSAEAPWLGMARRALRVHAEFVLSPSHGGLPGCEATAAFLVPDGSDPADGGGLRMQRAGPWWLLGQSWRQLAVPERPHQVGPVSGGDLVLAAFLPAWPHLLPADRAEPLAEVLRVWNLTQVQVQVDLGAGRFADRMQAPKAQLPLLPVEAEALAGIPADALAVVACGLDGPALAKQSQLLLSAAGGDPLTAERSLQEIFGLGLEGLVAAIDGTVSLSLHGSSSQPAFVLSLPLTPPLRDALGHWLEYYQAGQGAALAAMAAEQAVPCVLPGVGPLFVRLGHGRLYCSPVAPLVDACAADPALPFPVAQQWPGAVGAVALARWQAGVLGAVLTPDPVSPSPLAAGLRACAAVLALTPPGCSVVHQDAQGVHSSGEHALAWLAPLIALAPRWAPPLATAYRQACDQEVAQNLRTILDRCRAFSRETNGHWPRDVADLRAWAKDLGDEIFANAGRPDLRQPFCYVSPLVDPPADQPVLVQDPAANAGRGSWVGYADGRVIFAQGVPHWQEALRLAALVKARQIGIEISDWATTPKTF